MKLKHDGSADQPSSREETVLVCGACHEFLSVPQDGRGAVDRVADEHAENEHGGDSVLVIPVKETLIQEEGERRVLEFVKQGQARLDRQSVAEL
jgi:2-C-methyl-D-erythritol 4-phosphate cytidylyltransferase